ncbi:MAG: BrnT family toxin [Chitinivibrionales bacterium]|nr:BrnT family toxin [Chitinivibrionales bacterium]
MNSLFISNLNGFLWDDGNRTKNREKHNVAVPEIEEVFLNAPLFFFEDAKHSDNERRTLALGKTFGERLLSIAFTIRLDKIRVISARDMSKKERKTYYEEASEENTAF